MFHMFIPSLVWMDSTWNKVNWELLCWEATPLKRWVSLQAARKSNYWLAMTLWLCVIDRMTVKSFNRNASCICIWDLRLFATWMWSTHYIVESSACFQSESVGMEFIIMVEHLVVELRSSWMEWCEDPVLTTHWLCSLIVQAAAVCQSTEACHISQDSHRLCLHRESVQIWHGWIVPCFPRFGWHTVDLSASSPVFLPQVQPSNYCTFYDDQRQNWSVMFESEKAALDFCKEVELMLPKIP